VTTDGGADHAHDDLRYAHFGHQKRRGVRILSRYAYDPPSGNSDYQEQNDSVHNNLSAFAAALSRVDEFLYGNSLPSSVLWRMLHLPSKFSR
jgi:hypothetical protein